MLIKISTASPFQQHPLPYSGGRYWWIFHPLQTRDREIRHFLFRKGRGRREGIASKELCWRCRLCEALNCFSRNIYAFIFIAVFHRKESRRLAVESSLIFLSLPIWLKVKVLEKKGLEKVAPRHHFWVLWLVSVPLIQFKYNNFVFL